MLPRIAKTFINLRKNHIKLNPCKCSFGMEEGNFFKVIVTNNGIKANMKKVATILDMPSPLSVKDVEILNGRLVSLIAFRAAYDFLLLYIDGASNTENAGVGLLLTSPKGIELAHAMKLSYKLNIKQWGRRICNTQNPLLVFRWRVTIWLLFLE